MNPDQNAFDRPRPVPFEQFRDEDAAVARVVELYEAHTAFLRERFAEVLKTGQLKRRVRATYPEIRVETSTFANVDSRLAYGHLAAPGLYSATVTRPQLFKNYLTDQIRLIVRNHGLPVEVGPSAEPIPL